MNALLGVVLLLAGALLGGLVAWTVERSRLAVWRDRARRLETVETERHRLESEAAGLKIQAAELRKEREADAAKLAWAESAEGQLREAFAALAATALQTNNAQFLQQSREQIEGLLRQVRGDWGTQREAMRGLVGPLEQTLGKLETQVRELEHKREVAYHGLVQHVEQLGRLQLGLQSATADLTHALKSSSTVRGRWGEMQLRRIVEMAGMVEHVDFDEQPTGDPGRPDMVVHLPHGGVLPVDAKAPLEAYLAAVEERDEAIAAERFADHARALRGHMIQLSRRAYWAQFERTPDLVVLVVPYESGLAAAFRADGKLLEEALDNKVLIASPVTLFALLKAVGYGWLQWRLAENAQRIAEEGQALYERLRVFAGHVGDVGKRLDATVQAFNCAVGSLESRVYPAASRLKAMGAGSADLCDVETLENRPRVLREP